jgi:cytochrome c biogenesis protein CcmG/thiol:disulfide interchange protein DsbE
VLIGVVFQDSADAARDYTARLGNTWASALDGDGRMALSYGVFGPPETYFIGADGIIAGRHIGPIDEQTLMTGIETLRAKSATR